MKLKLKLNIRKELKVAVALIGLFVLIGFSEREQKNVVCTDVVVDMSNIHENQFMDEADVLKLVEGSGFAIKGVAIDRINLKEIENKIKYDKHILAAELYGDLKGNLVVSVTLRRPVARIIREDGPDAYIAEDGTIMPVSEKFTSRVVLVSGPAATKFMESDNLNKTDQGKAVLDMIRLINKNDFWRAQVAQLDVNKEGKVVIYPQVTGQLVEFGKPENLEAKFRKLMIFYKEILPQRGWTRYKRVNLEYEGQVIAE